jgi:hypothetical protein
LRREIVSADTEAKYELSVCKWEGRIHCVYLNDYRVAGGKPWGGASDMKTWPVTMTDLANAVPAIRKMQAALERIATVDMGGGFLGAQACRKVAADALAKATTAPEPALGGDDDGAAGGMNP